jgi:LysM repeat protein
MLRRWNGLRGSSLSGRRVLALHLPITPGHDTEVATSHSKTKKASQTATTKPPAAKSAEFERMDVAKNDVEKEAPRREVAESAVERGKVAHETIHHKVKAGETLYSIANAYRTTVAALKRDNRNIAVLRPGMILVVQLAR